MLTPLVIILLVSAVCAAELDYPAVTLGLLLGAFLAVLVDQR
jgi:hypothetical protein